MDFLLFLSSSYDVLHKDYIPLVIITFYYISVSAKAHPSPFVCIIKFLCFHLPAFNILPKAYVQQKLLFFVQRMA